ncbi:HlyD family efflux transporter periplasmic adaptor subunit [Sulfurimonas sp.]|jgi:RND family efflux transporter MFP subunit|uniref:efflux RND transporter periplasmic adaptor subunit n=1 Tax=Sulfurimonas sp. TaxID=2022749 RepID=UPI0025F27C95|nr:HlyD family efflux transporter periplasmic adaptor subunit [Sulfurimonas sp.]MBT5934290.1 HlyD family efflux transporter periplasmic adaptor subunit [Sulfurimonas sp.]
MQIINKTLLGLLLSLSLLNANDVYATFTVEPLRDANLAFIASGIVEKVNTDIGHSVKKNDVLAQLQNTDIKAMLEVSKTALKYAKKDYERQLKIKELIDEARFDGVANKYESAKNQFAYQQALYSKTFLKAPFNGVIYSKEIEIGDAVSGMMLKTVFQIQSQTKRKLILAFDQKNRNLVKVGSTFTYKIDGNSRIYVGSISKIYPRADSKSRKIRAEVKTINFIPGLFGDGYIQVKE